MKTLLTCYLLPLLHRPAHGGLGSTQMFCQLDRTQSQFTVPPPNIFRLY
jgi:hypothetical protein